MYDDANKPWSLTADWIVPIAQPPLRRGVVTIQGDRIVAIEPVETKRADIDLGQSAVLPGFVNAHTHLDLSDLRGKLRPGPDFTDWLRSVIRHRRAQSPVETNDAIRQGIKESVAKGTTLLGDVSAGGVSWPMLATAACRSVVFLELLGLPVERAESIAKHARDWISAHPGNLHIRPGLSPHAPYSVSEKLFEAAVAIAEEQDTPLAIHIAETRAELELLARRAGPLVPFLQELGVWQSAALIQDLDELVTMTRSAKTLFIHGNYLPTIPALGDTATIVYCPRTHAAFGHEPHPLQKLLEAGVRVALGTDSLASNPDLSVLEEARFVRRTFPQITGADILRMATLAGAQALGWDTETGSLESKNSADMVVVALENDVASDPENAVLMGDKPVSRVLFRGRWVH